MTTWRVTQSFGDSDIVARLVDHAITMASATGSVGASYSESDTQGNTIAFAEVERTN